MKLSKISVWVWGLLSMSGWLLSMDKRVEVSTHAPYRPIYNKSGELLAPTGYQSWVYVGSTLSTRYKPEIPGGGARKAVEEANPGSFHNVYIDPESFRAYQKTGKFPDPTVLVMEVYSAATRDEKGFLSSGRFPDKRVAVEVAVKDSRRPGGGVPWAYYDFKLERDRNLVQSSKAFPDSKCYDCHLKHADVDNVWVQFYPTLRDKN